jgi:predicted dehydrogenase
MKGVAAGAGYFAAFHCDAWQRLGGIAALCDLDQARARALAKRYAIPRVYIDVAAMLDAEKPDFLDIITPPATHLALVEAAARRGVAVVCQKPLAPSPPEALALVACAEEHGIRLMVHENFRFQPWHREIRRQLGAGAIGELHGLTIRTRLGDGWQADAYQARQPYFRTMPRLLLFETGIHFFDLMRYHGGEIARVSAWTARHNRQIAGEDSALVVAEWASGARATWDADRYAEPLDDADPRLTFGEFLFEGSAGRLHLAPSGRLTRKPLGQPEEQIPLAWSARGFGGDCVLATLQHFLEALRAGTPFETEGHDYLRTIAVQEAAYRAAESGVPQTLPGRL